MKTGGFRFDCPGREIDEGGLFVFVESQGLFENI
jgi:hypothetical protein